MDRSFAAFSKWALLAVLLGCMGGCFASLLGCIWCGLYGRPCLLPLRPPAAAAAWAPLGTGRQAGAPDSTSPHPACAPAGRPRFPAFASTRRRTWWSSSGWPRSGATWRARWARLPAAWVPAAPMSQRWCRLAKEWRCLGARRTAATSPLTQFRRGALEQRLACVPPAVKQRAPSAASCPADGQGPQPAGIRAAAGG